MKRLLISIFFLISLSAHSKENAYLFFNENFFKIFPEERENYDYLKSRLSPKFKIIETRYFTFDSLPNEINKLTAKYKEGLFVTSDFLSPLIIKSTRFSAGSEDGNKYKLFTYNLPPTTPAALPVFNVTIDIVLIKDKIASISKKYSGKKDFSDCGLIVNVNDAAAGQIMNMLAADGHKYAVNMSPENSLNWLGSNKTLKAVFFFSGKDNLVMTQIESEELKKIKYIEIFTNYGQALDFVKHRITIDWKKSFKTAIDSRDFGDFIRSENTPALKNFIINKNVIIDMQ